MMVNELMQRMRADLKALKQLPYSIDFLFSTLGRRSQALGVDAETKPLPPTKHPEIQAKIN